MTGRLTVADLTRPLAEVAMTRPEWERGDVDEAIVATLRLSASSAHARAPVAWAWAGSDIDGVPIVLLPVVARDVMRFAPVGPVRILTRSYAAAVSAGASIDRIGVFEWNGLAGLRLPGADLSVFALDWADAHPAPTVTDAEEIPAEIAVDSGVAVRLSPPASPAATGLGTLARTLRTHPLRFVPVLWEQGWRLDEDAYPDDVIEALRHRGFEGPEEPEDEPSQAIDDDPDPRRRIARRLVRRLLHKGKIGPTHHTAFDHIAHGVAPQNRADAYGVGEALVRAGYLGEKPSVGQRHVFLRREALSEIHAFIATGETDDPTLSALFTVPIGGAG